MPRHHLTTASAPPPPHQRADGAFESRFGPNGALRHLFQQAPLRVLFPTPDPGETPLAAVVNCAGGLAGGDALRQEVALEAGARATVSTAAAEKVYRSLGAETRIATRLALGPGAVLEWIPQETILFDGARLERRLRVDLAEGAILLAAEMLVFGRVARGERMRRGALLDAWRVHGPEGLLWADALALPDDPGEALGAPFGFDGAEALGTVLLAGPGAEAGRDLLRGLASAAPGGATLPRPGLLLARWLGPGAAVRASVGAAIVALRAGLLGLPPRLPRLWTT
jgi:urease accessory protein